MTWAAQYIGEPWIAGEHDCWAFARRVWREQFGRDVPAVDVDPADKRACILAFSGASLDERGNWLQVEHPEDGDAVLLGSSNRPSHVGVWCAADGGGVVHCVRKSGVIYSKAAALNMTGWRVLGFYRRKSA